MRIRHDLTVGDATANLQQVAEMRYCRATITAIVRKKQAIGRIYNQFQAAVHRLKTAMQTRERTLSAAGPARQCEARVQSLDLGVPFPGRASAPAIDLAIATRGRRAPRRPIRPHVPLADAREVEEAAVVRPWSSRPNQRRRVGPARDVRTLCNECHITLNNRGQI